MDKEKAIGILVGAATLAQKSGVLTLGDARIVADAVDFFKTNETPKEAPEVKEEAKS